MEAENLAEQTASEELPGRKKLKVWQIVLICIAPVLLFLCSVGFALWINNTFTLEVLIQGDEEITIEYQQDYEEQGATAKFWGKWFMRKPVDLEVTVSGEVDTETLGTYEITYTAAYRKFTGEAKRTVTVTDSQAPVITLVSNPESFTECGETYEEEGFTATDNYDGDLSAKVKRKEEDGKVIYTVTDSAGNTATQIREIVYRDTIAPQISLTGFPYVTISAGGTYTEPGYSATDNIDGDITANVTVSGWVDVYKPGSYTLTYTATDNGGNSASTSRTVTVLPLKPEEIGAPNGKVIYLTFDDGPGPHTGRLLDVLAKYNVKATFFVVNTGYIGEIARQAREGHTVAIHTATHRFQDLYQSEEAFFWDLTTMQGIIEEYTGQKPMLLRFPGGSSNTISRQYNAGIMSRLTTMVREYGYQYFDWNVDSGDAGGASSSQQVFQNVINGVSKHESSVVLQHDIKGFSVDAVEKIIVWGLLNGYTFLPLDASSPGCHHGVLN